MKYGTTFKTIQYYFENRNSSRKKEWQEVKLNFIDTALEALINEKVDGLVFQFAYHRIVNIDDQEMFDHITASMTERKNG